MPNWITPVPLRTRFHYGGNAVTEIRRIRTAGEIIKGLDHLSAFDAITRRMEEVNECMLRLSQFGGIPRDEEYKRQYAKLSRCHADLNRKRSMILSLLPSA